ncbi:cyanophycinase [Tumebacillus sp. BK434]|uniref:cyanophycinase n=1 Tax=Tumebacillus sp. BK434 TaxID=2512169 RepID=UPI00104EDDD4|nr:cyanophycinase [Tumebacillus sp. BK434]TCP55423.1 cyanophycinase [Tumebacillus sp. BK434]
MNGKLVLAGGALREDNAEVYGKIVELAGGVGRAKIGIVTAASEPEEAEANGAYYQELFCARYGVREAEWIPLHAGQIGRRDDAALLELVQTRTGYFFGGGDQSKIVACLLHEDHTDSRAMAVIRARFAKGALVAGTSAGAVVQSVGPMVTGGAGSDDVTWNPRGGLGLFPYGLLDSHFSERRRLARMLHLAEATGWQRVYGIDEDTALVVQEGQGTVLGANRLVVADLRDGGAVRLYAGGERLELNASG